MFDITTAKNIYEFMQNLPIEGNDTCIDALTLTATGLTGKLAIGLILVEMEDYLLGQRQKKFTFQGAVGWQKGSVRYAERLNALNQKLWAILMVTGPQSFKAFARAAKMQSDVKFTRCDIAVDIFLYEPVVGIPRLIADNYKGSFSLKLIESDTGDTVYIGSRQSEAMLRIYDKSAEYSLDQGRVWRWECEYKGQLAPLVVRDAADGGTTRMRQIVFEEAATKGVPSPIIEASRGIKRERVSASSSDMTLAWLERQVAPSVKFLKSLGRGREVVKALRIELDDFE